MIKSMFWIIIGYVAGVFAFSIAFILDAGLGNDAVGAVVEGVQRGLVWPRVLYDLFAGNLTA